MKPPAIDHPTRRALVVEGGGMRGIFSAGVLDAFIEHPPPDCRVRVMAPPRGFAVGRLTKDRSRLEAGYAMGLAAGRAVV